MQTFTAIKQKPIYNLPVTKTGLIIKTENVKTSEFYPVLAEIKMVVSLAGLRTFHCLYCLPNRSIISGLSIIQTL